MTRSDAQLLLHHQFDEQARRTPAAVALYEGERSITYAELEHRADAIARALRAQGIGEGAVVGLHVERSMTWVSAALGILKTNATVLPLPPSYPVGRLEEILAHAALDAVVDDETTPLDPTLTVRRLRLETLSSGADTPRAESGHADQTAFVLCSSGSTGTPKMIARSHRSFQHRLHWTWERHPYAAGEVCCQKAHATTTHGIYELFEPLLRGVPVVIIGDRDARNLEVFWDIIRARNVTRLLIVPSALHATLDMPGFVPPPLRVVVLMGEYVSPDLAARAVAAFPPTAHLYSIYGSTEASSTLVCDLRAALRPGQELPLGTPISDDVRPHVLGPDRKPVGPGEVGTLYMSGTPLFTEYFRSPELTDAVIVQDPPYAERLYDTHDQVRSMPDGSLEFVGRADNMVKIRGFRVDPQDVERALLSHPEVRRAAVVVRDGGSGHATLMAFVTPADVDSASVFRALRERLPPYMIPSAVVGVERFPLTASGKLDRLRLLDDYATHAARPAADGSATETALRIAEIWQQVLGHAEFGLDTSFFEAGGSSLSVFAVVHRLRGTFGLDRGRLPEQSVYRFPTIATLAGHVDEVLAGRPSMEAHATPILVTLRHGRDTTHAPLFLIASAGGTLG
ncbi:MAG TPA: non-ribosomal peptide synthetase, partial [Gemmatimonadales bacterium]|nr:non-ribosomal peptide synthetase [Gemmatimonadales bacterium]